MDQFQYRRPARIVAIIDLVLTSIALIIPIFLLIAALTATFVAVNPDVQQQLQEAIDQSSGTHLDKEKTRVLTTFWLVFTWVLLFVVSALILLTLVAAVKLLHATSVGKNPADAVKLARFWMIVTVIFQIFAVMGLFVPQQVLTLVFSIISIVVHFVFICIVRNFIGEAEAVAFNVLPSHRGQVPLEPGVTYNYTPDPKKAAGGLPHYDEVTLGKM